MSAAPHPRARELPLVSVLIPTYNHAAYLARSLDSVLSQDYASDRMQVVVLDDGSKDDTPKVIEPYLDRVQYIRTPNGGLIATMNRLFAEATGELIAVQSGDDVWTPGRLWLQVERFLDRPELGLVYGDMRVIDAEDRILHESYWEMHRITPLRGRVLPRLMCGNVVSGGTMMVRASLLPRFHPIPAFAAWEDWWTALRVAEVAEIDYISTPLLGYRQHGANMNLGAEGAAELRRYAAELPLRRWIVTDIECPQARVADWVEVYQHWTGIMRMVAGGTGVTLESLAPVDDAGREAAGRAIGEAGERIAAGELAQAVREAVRALGHDPFDQACLHVLQATLSAIETAQDPPALPGARGFVTLAHTDELLSEPGLLAAYGATFSGDDDASLVVLVDPEQVPALAELVERTALDGDEAAQIIGVPVPAGYGDPAAELAPRVHAVLSARTPAGRLALHPHVGRPQIAQLRRLAERRWASRVSC